MTVFNEYARYYDLLYRDKDYQSEVDYIHSLLKLYAPSISSVLELGCGTGRHAEFLARYGYQVYGVDQSADMLARANERLAGFAPEFASRLNFAQGDVRTIRLNKTFDSVVSLFHVISYQTANADLLAAFKTAATHLRAGGFFLFDCWYGPAVLSERPENRVKELSDDLIVVHRKATPEMFDDQNVVAVNYDIEIRDRATGHVSRVEECHRMRYLFLPEIDLLLEQCGMHRVYAAEWMTEQKPGMATWSVCVGARVTET